jgi:hypothetical protein
MEAGFFFEFCNMEKKNWQKFPKRLTKLLKFTLEKHTLPKIFLYFFVKKMKQKFPKK